MKAAASTVYTHAAARLAATLALAVVVLGAGGPSALGAQGAKGKAVGPGSPLPKPSIPEGPKVPTTFEELFAERSGRALGALGYLRCMQSTVNALRSGALGDVPRSWTITCVQQGGEWRGVFGELTDGKPGMRVHLQYALRGTGGGMLVSDAVDTARVSGTARALLRGLAAPLPGAGKYEYVPIALAQKTFVEVLFVPVPGDPSRVVVGGDSVIQMSADGVRELGHSRSTPPIRTFAVQPTGDAYLLESREERIPLVSELIVAHLARDMVADVRIRTRQYETALTRGARAPRHVRR